MSTSTLSVAFEAVIIRGIRGLVTPGGVTCDWGSGVATGPSYSCTPPVAGTHGLGFNFSSMGCTCIELTLRNNENESVPCALCVRRSGSTSGIPWWELFRLVLRRWDFMSSVVLTRHGCCGEWRWRCSSVGFSDQGPTWSVFSAETSVDNWSLGFALSYLGKAWALQVVPAAPGGVGRGFMHAACGRDVQEHACGGESGTDKCVGQTQTELFPSSFSDSFTLRVIKGSKHNVVVSSCAHSRVCVYEGLEAMFAYTHVTVRKTNAFFL